LIGIILL
jgi:hypothetical protein